MTKKKGIAGLCLLACLLISFAIQFFSAPLYPEGIAKIDQIEIKDQKQSIQATKMNGKKKGEQFQLTAKYRTNELDATTLQKGNQIFYHNNEVGEKKRDGFIFFMLSFLFVTLIFIGGKTGMTTFISVILNSGALFLLVSFYRHHTNISLLIFTGIYTLFAIAITLFLIDGFKKNSLQKFFATVLTVAVSFFICFGMMTLLSDKGLRFEDMGVLTRPYRPIFLAGLMIGAVGASLDTVVTVISTLEEIEAKNPDISPGRLIKAGRQVGKDISTTMMNVLVCSYFSSAIPMILIYLHNGWTFSQTINMQLSLEIVRILCGGFGILLSIPFALLCFQFSRKKEGSK